MPLSVWAADYYVATIGSDGNDGSSGNPWKTITHALGQATTGDTIHVAAGTYSGTTTGETLPLRLKTGVNLSGANRDTTILDGGGATAVVSASGVTGGSLSGFTITQGKDRLGGGVKVVNSGVSITDNIIKNNAAGSGAGIYGRSFSGAISNNTINANQASDTGGGIRLVDSGGGVSNNIISQNSAGAGAGIYVAGESAGISANEIVENQAYMHGGGLYIADFAGAIVRNIIRSNQASTGSGGGIYAVNFSGSLNNNLVVKNTADAVGGIYAVGFAAGSEIVNNTIADNVGTLAESVGGMQAEGVSSVLKNNIFWNNGDDDLFGELVGATFAELREETVSISYSLIDDYAGQNSNIYTNPLFIDSANDDYHLSDTSPAIDAGTSDGAPAVDLAGDPRAQGVSTDLGAYEYALGTPPSASSIIVKADKHHIQTGSHPGSTKEPYVGLTVNVYDKSDSCVAGYDFSWQWYSSIVSNCTAYRTDSTVYSASAGSAVATIGVDAGEYLVIGVGVDGTDKHLGTSATVAEDERVEKYLQQLITAAGKKISGKSHKHEGSLLLITEPEYVEWDSTEELYPFIFETLDHWGVLVEVETPRALYLINQS